jgi:hypothetical protein
MGCQSLVRIVILPSARTRELFYSPYTFLPNRLSTQNNFLSSRPPTIHSPSYNGQHGYYNGGNSANDYFSVDPRPSQQSHLSSTLRPGSSQSTTSPTLPQPSLYPQDDVEPIYGWGEKPSLSRADSARPPLPPKQPFSMPEPSIPTEELYSSYPNSGGGLNGTSASIYRNDSSGSYVLPPLPNQPYPPGQIVNPHTDSQSCKALVLLRECLILILCG